MSYKTSIECTEATWNPVTGCSKVSPGCRNCYAEREWRRLSANSKTVYFGRRFTAVQCHPERLQLPLRWRSPRLIFVNSMSDLFHDDIPDDFIVQVFKVIHDCPHHRFMIITKRAARMRRFVLYRLGMGACLDRTQSRMCRDYPNAWLSVSVENQETANERVPVLLDTPAAVRFVTAEPLLGPIDLKSWLPGASGKNAKNSQESKMIHWLIAGGETGPRARPVNLDWARSLRDQCLKAKVAFFFKHRGNCRMLDDGTTQHVSKKENGRELDGRTWDEFPPQYLL
jgi:protein gp37